MTVTASRLIAADPADIWRVLTSRDGMKAFMMGADVETDWRVGGPIVMRGEMGGKRFEDHGEIRSFEPRRRLSYTHQSSAAPGQTHIVTFELKEREQGTEVTVIQSPATDVDPASEARMTAQYEKTWAGMLEALERAVIH